MLLQGFCQSGRRLSIQAKLRGLSEQMKTGHCLRHSEEYNRAIGWAVCKSYIAYAVCSFVCQVLTTIANTSSTLR